MHRDVPSLFSDAGQVVERVGRQPLGLDIGPFANDLGKLGLLLGRELGLAPFARPVVEAVEASRVVAQHDVAKGLN